jgi:hypothetical protein
MRSFLPLLTSALLLAGMAHAAPPQRVEIAYEVLRDGSRLADIVESLEHGDGRYRLVETWRGRGLYALRGRIVRSSRGLVGPAGLQPEEFSDERSGREPSRASFDWKANTLTMQRRGETQTLPIPANAQDRLSFLLALSFAPPLARPASFSVADGGSISRYVFELVGRERIKVPAGEFDALKLARRRDGPEDRRSTEIWLAPSHGHLPVRVVLTEKDGTRIDQQATRISTP